MLFRVLLGIALLLVLARMMNATARTHIYYAIQRWWRAHWPFSRGVGLPALVRPWMKPFVPVWVQLEPTIRMRLDPNDLVSRVIMETGAWEAAPKVIENCLATGGTFVDVGAHIGYYTLKAAAIVGPSGRVLAIEPNPDTVAKLRENVRASNAEAVTVLAVACFDTEATVNLFAAPKSNSGKGSISKANSSEEGPVSATHQVTAMTLDAVIKDAGLSRIDLIKIDVEGAEFAVLKGAQATLARYLPVLFIELEDELLKPMNASVAGVIDFLRSLGYTLVCRHDEANFEFRPVRTADRAGQAMSVTTV